MYLVRFDFVQHPPQYILKFDLNALILFGGPGSNLHLFPSKQTLYGDNGKLSEFLTLPFDEIPECIDQTLNYIEQYCCIKILIGSVWGKGS